MKAVITPSKLKGTVSAVASKSYAHRIIIASALADRPTKIYLNTTSEDIEATKRCIKALGSKIDEGDGFITVSPTDCKSRENILLDCGESGSTARFILPVAAVLCGKFEMQGSGRLPERPMQPLTEQMSKHGVHFDSEKIPIKAQGKLTGGEFYLSANISSQYITGLLFALSKLAIESKITLTTELESSAYVDITTDVLQKFSVDIKKGKGFYEIPVSKYISPEEITVEGDWSNAAFWICADKISGGITVSGLNYKSIQSDRRILDETDKNMIDAREIPDLVPVLAALACAKNEKTVIHNASRLRIKESDRIKTMMQSLNALGADICETEDGLIINSHGRLSGGECDGYGDHRIVMACAVASCICTNEVIINGAEAVNKSYPTFFEDFKKLGGIVKFK